MKVTEVKQYALEFTKKEYEKYSETVWKEIEKAEEEGHPWQSYFCNKMGVYTADEREDFLEEY